MSEGPSVVVPTSLLVELILFSGGGFGGKESQAVLVALPVAIAAHK